MSTLSPIGDLSAEIVTRPSLRELASGVDALYLSGWATLPDDFMERLERAKGRALDAGEAVGFRLGGVEFGLTPHGWGRYPYRLSHQYGMIGFARSQALPAVRVQPRAELLAGLGPGGVVDTFADVLQSVTDVDFSVARVDLYADFQDWQLRAEDRRRFVSRATSRNTFEESDDLTGVQWGRRSGGGLVARIYEKSGQARKTGSEWWFDRWGGAYTPGEPVYRVEFEFGRKVLRECQVDTPANLFENVAGLWGYATTKWLSYRTPSADETKSRWPVAPEWKSVQSASLRDRPVTVERTIGSKRAASKQRIVSGMCGYLSSFAALRNVSTIDEAWCLADPVLREWELETGIPFAARVVKKRRHWEWGL